jgi:hypothetical protein
MWISHNSSVDDYAVVHDMLKSGTVDIFFEEGIAETAFDVYGDVIAEGFFPLPYVPVFLRPGNPSLELVVSVPQKGVGLSLFVFTGISILKK